MWLGALPRPTDRCDNHGITADLRGGGAGVRGHVLQRFPTRDWRFPIERQSAFNRRGLA